MMDFKKIEEHLEDACSCLNQGDIKHAHEEIHAARELIVECRLQWSVYLNVKKLFTNS